MAIQEQLGILYEALDEDRRELDAMLHGALWAIGGLRSECNRRGSIGEFSSTELGRMMAGTFDDWVVERPSSSARKALESIRKLVESGDASECTFPKFYDRDEMRRLRRRMESTYDELKALRQEVDELLGLGGTA